MFKRFFPKKKVQPTKQLVERGENASSIDEALVGAGISKENKQAFNKMVEQNIQRYLSAAGTTMDLDLKTVTGQPISFADAYPSALNEWSAVQSIWDQRTIIYSLLDELLGKELHLWQRMMRLVDDRFAEKALKEAQNMESKDFEDSNFWAAKAKMCIVLTNYKAAVQAAEKALALDPNNRLAKIQLADAYHLKGESKEALILYQNIIQNSPKGRVQKGQPLKISIQDLLSFEGDVLHSPLYAASTLNQASVDNLDYWELMANEFYWSPQYRAQHAYFMLQHGEPLKGLAKLLALSKEMPWYKEAILNSHRLIHQMNGTEVLTGELTRLNELITASGWLNDL